jgi:hypothetical protein
MHYFLCPYCQTLEKCSEAVVRLTHWHAACQYVCPQVTMQDLIRRGQIQAILLHDMQTEEAFTGDILGTVFPLQTNEASDD